jgi:hypothetical protein
MVERFNRSVNEAIAQRGKITDNSGKNTLHSHPEGNTYIINFVEAYNRTALQCLKYRAPSSILFDNHPEGNTETRRREEVFPGGPIEGKDYDPLIHFIKKTAEAPL